MNESRSATIDRLGQQNSTHTIFTPPSMEDSTFHPPFLTSSERLEILKEKCKTEFANYRVKMLRYEQMCTAYIVQILQNA